MKKLLLAINLVVYFAAFSCKNFHSSKTEKITIPKTDVKRNDLAADTLSETKHLPASGVSGNDKGIKKDELNHTEPSNAIIHSAPEQERIDSIKNAKLKIKK